MLEYGDEVKVKPAAAHCPPGSARSNVIADPHTGRFMLAKGETVRWSTFHAERLRQGEIEIVIDPTPPDTSEVRKSVVNGSPSIEVK